jgi:hypothetical protein
MEVVYKKDFGLKSLCERSNESNNNWLPIFSQPRNRRCGIDIASKQSDIGVTK